MNRDIVDKFDLTCKYGHQTTFDPVPEPDDIATCEGCGKRYSVSITRDKDSDGGAERVLIGVTEFPS